MGSVVKYIGIALYCLASASLSYADDLVDILDLALDNDPTLRQARAIYRANRENMVQSRSSLLPSLGVGGTTSRQTSGPTDSIYTTITDPLSGDTTQNPRVRGSQLQAGYQ